VIPPESSIRNPSIIAAIEDLHSALCSALQRPRHDDRPDLRDARRAQHPRALPQRRPRRRHIVHEHDCTRQVRFPRTAKRRKPAAECGTPIADRGELTAESREPISNAPRTFARRPGPGPRASTRCGGNELPAPKSLFGSPADFVEDHMADSQNGQSAHRTPTNLDRQDQLVRPEWLFEMVSQAQRLAFTPVTGELALPATDDAAPASLCEQQLAECIRNRLLKERDRASQILRDTTQPRDESFEDRLSTSVRRAAEVLRDEHAADWSTERLARRVGCNRTNLQARFKEVFGYSIHKHLAISRVESAKRLLRQTHWRVSEISIAVGYRSKSSLHANFRSVVGISPEEYRAR